jgi:hypothetical protein
MQNQRLLMAAANDSETTTVSLVNTLYRPKFAFCDVDNTLTPLSLRLVANNELRRDLRDNSQKSVQRRS